MIKKKRENPTDATLRNVRGSKRRDDRIMNMLRALERRIAVLEAWPHTTIAIPRYKVKSKPRTIATGLLLLVILSASGCRLLGQPPPTLSPAGVSAFNAKRVIDALDVLRNFAVDANAQTPQLLSTVTTRKVVVYHRSAVIIIGDVPSGWAHVVQVGLDELLLDLPPPERTRVQPYVALVKVLIQEVSR